MNGSENLPLADDLLSVVEAVSLLNPPPPSTAACVGCHDSRPAPARAATHTTKLGEGCDTCHGTSADTSVASVHGR